MFIAYYARMSDDGSFVQSITGLEKKVCERGHKCHTVSCPNAHPNAAGSRVLHPKWCLRGDIDTCKSPTCPFNHFITERDFVAYRSADDYWAVDNWELIEKYSRRFTVGDFVSK